MNVKNILRNSLLHDLVELFDTEEDVRKESQHYIDTFSSFRWHRYYLAKTTFSSSRVAGYPSNGESRNSGSSSKFSRLRLLVILLPICPY